ncbi:MAG: sigma-E factor negative regulatory protein [Gammaproteobacteria bacterium]
MSEQVHEQVSAFLDDELSPEECAFLVRRLERDPDSRGKLVRYSLIGSVLRDELLLPEPDLLRRRIQCALDGTPLPAKSVAAASPAAAHARWANPAVGLGLAASVAVAALFSIRAINGSDDADAPARATASTVPSYVVPGDNGDSLETRVLSPVPMRLTNYLLHHGEYARLSRTSVHSNVVGAELPFVPDAVVVDDAPVQYEREVR